jgi:hypothetical protein
MAFILLLKFPDLAIIKLGQQNIGACEKSVISWTFLQGNQIDWNFSHSPVSQNCK